MSKKISVKVENEQQYNVVMSIMRGYIPWNSRMGEHPTAVIISNKDENGKKDKNHQKGAVGCAERQKMDGYKIISFSELESGSMLK